MIAWDVVRIALPGFIAYASPASDLGGGITVVLFGFMDGSGTHEGSPVVSIAGFVGSESEMLELHAKWSEILDDKRYPTRLSEFHMYDCVQRDKEFLDGHWGFGARLTLYGSLCDLLASSQVRPVGAAVITDCFEKIPKEDLDIISQDNVRLGTPLDVCFQMIAQQIIHAVEEIGGEETIGVIFDKDNKDREQKFSGFCDQYISSYYVGDLLAGYGFGDSKKLNAVQAADLLAYGTMLLAMSTEYPTATLPDFPVLPALMRTLNKFAESPYTSPLGKIFNLETLKNVVDKVKRGDTLPRKAGL